MSYFKDLNGKLHYLDDDNFINLLPSDSVKITDEEAEQIRISQLDANVVPSQVTMSQARQALYDEGLLSLVDETINLMPIQEQRDKAKIQWEFETIVKRDSALVYGLAGGLGLTDKMLDDLFIKASKI